MTGRFPPPGSTAGWNGRAVANARAWLAQQTTWPTPCARCGRPVTPQHWHLGHRADRQHHPELTWVTSNWQIEHPHCSSSAGAAQGNKRRPTATRINNANAKRNAQRKPNAISSEAIGAGPPLPVTKKNVPGMPPMHPEGFPLPRIHPQLPPGTDFGLAREAIAAIDESVPGPPLMPWQRFALERALATVPDRHSSWRHRFVFSTVVLRLSRQQGKTFLLRRVGWWRLMVAGALLGQPQRLINTHPDGRQSVRLMEPLARSLGYGQGGLKGLTAQTFMALWFPGGVESDDAPAWFARAMTTNALTGNAGITWAYVDELQDAKRTIVQEALGGSLSGARVVGPQRWFTGTGEKPGSDLLRSMRARIGRPGMCWIEWSVPAGTDPGDETGWRWASPDWSPARRDYLAEQLDELTAPEFAANYLLSDEALAAGEVLVDPRVWGSLTVQEVPAPLVAAVEAPRFGSPVVVCAGRDESGRAVVSAHRVADTAQAAQMCRAAGVPLVLVGKSLLADPVWAGLEVEKRQGTDAEACADLGRLVAEGVLVHDGSTALSEEVTGTHMVGVGAAARPSVSGLAAVKAAAWAAHHARAFEPFFVM